MAKTPEAMNSTFVDTKLKAAGLVRPWKIHDSFSVGKPDSEYIRRDGNAGRVLKIEYKFMAELPKRDSTIITPSWANELQRVRLGEYFDTDGNAWAVIFVGRNDADCIVLCNKDEWNDGITTATARARLIKRKDLAAMITYWVTKGEFGHLTIPFRTTNGNLGAFA